MQAAEVLSRTPGAETARNPTPDRLITHRDAHVAHAALLAGTSDAYAYGRLENAHDVWQQFALERRLPYYARHEDLCVLFTDLFDSRVALQHQILPHRTSGQDICVVTYDHTRKDTYLSGVGMVKHALVTPRTWRFLFDLAYPRALTGPLSWEEAVALATLTPLGTDAGLTSEQFAEAKALQRDLPYLDPAQQPPQVGVQHLIESGTQRHRLVIPHSVTNGTLTVLMADPDDDSTVRLIELQTQLNVRRAVTTKEAITALLPGPT